METARRAACLLAWVVVLAATALAQTSAELSLDQTFPTHTHGKAEAGDTVDYTLTLRNTGALDLTNVVIQNFIDVLSTIVDGSLSITPTAVDESGYVVVVGSTLSVPDGATDLLANDALGLPAATLTSFGGGDLGGAVTAHAAGASVAGAAGTLQVNATGSFSFTPDAGFSGSFSFDYRLTNSLGTSDGTVTLSTQRAPDAVDDDASGAAAFSVLPGDILTIADGNGDIVERNDDAGAPAGTVAGFGGGSLGGAVGDHPAGDTVSPLPGFTDGSLTVNGDGSVTFVPATAPTAQTGLFSFQYRLTNPAGSDDATVTIMVGVEAAAQDDAFDALGNTRLNLPASALFADNGNGGDGGQALEVTAVDGNTANLATPTATGNGGTVTVNADGSFTYDPPAGFTGVDTFTYTIDNDFSAPSTATVTITIANPIWYVDNTAASDGDGRQFSPFNNLASFRAIQTGAAEQAQAGHSIFLAGGGAVYTGGLVLLANQKLIGAGAAGDLGTALGLTVPPGASLPATGGTPPVIEHNAGDGITLAAGNRIEGLDVGDTTGAGLSGSGLGTLTVRQVGILGNGMALDLNGGTLDAEFTSINSTASAFTGIALDNVAGTMQVAGPTTITGQTNPNSIGLLIAGPSTVAVTFAGQTTITGANNVIGIQSEAAGAPNASVSFNGLDIDTAAGMGIDWNGGAFTATGTVDIDSVDGVGVQMVGRTASTAIAFGDQTTIGSTNALAASFTNCALSIAPGAGTAAFMSTNERGLDMISLSIGPGGLAIDQVSSGGGTDGIRMETIVGDVTIGSATLQNNTDDSLSLTNCGGTITIIEADIDPSNAPGVDAAVDIDGNNGTINLGTGGNGLDIDGGSEDGVEIAGSGTVNLGTGPAGSVAIDGVPEDALQLDGSGTVNVATDGGTGSIGADTDCFIGVTLDGDTTLNFNASIAFETDASPLVVGEFDYDTSTATFTGPITSSNADSYPPLSFIDASGSYTFTAPVELDTTNCAIPCLATGDGDGALFFGSTLTCRSGDAPAIALVDSAHDLTVQGQTFVTSNNDGACFEEATGTITFAGLNIGFVNDFYGLDLYRFGGMFTSGNTAIAGSGAADSFGIDLSGSTNPNGANAMTPNVLIGAGPGQTATISGVETGVLLGDSSDSAGAYLQFGTQTEPDSGSSIDTAGGFTIDTTDLVSTDGFTQGRYEFAGVTFGAGDKASFESVASELFFVAQNATGAGDGSSPSNRANGATLVSELGANNLAGATVVLINDGNAIDLGTSSAGLNDGTVLDGFGNGNTFMPFAVPVNVIVTEANLAVPSTITDPTGNGAATLTSSGTTATVELADGNVIRNVVLDGTGASAATILGDSFSGLTVTGAIVKRTYSSGGHALRLMTPSGNVLATDVSFQAEHNWLAVSGGNATIDLDKGTAADWSLRHCVITGTTGGSVTVTGLTADNEGDPTGAVHLDNNAAPVTLTDAVLAYSPFASQAAIEIDQFAPSTAAITVDGTSTITTDNHRAIDIGPGSRDIDLAAVSLNDSATDNFPLVSVSGQAGGTIDLPDLTNTGSTATNVIQVTAMAGGTLNFGDTDITGFGNGGSDLAVGIAGSGGTVTFDDLDITATNGSAFDAAAQTIDFGASPTLSATDGQTLNLSGSTLSGGAQTFASLTGLRSDYVIQMSAITGVLTVTSLTANDSDDFAVNAFNSGGLVINSGTIDASGTERIDIRNTDFALNNFTMGGTSQVTDSGLEVDTTSGSHTVALSNVSFADITGRPITIDGSGGGTLTVTAFNNVTCGGNGNGFLIKGVTFDADTSTGGIQAVTAGLCSIGTSGNRVDGDGLKLDQVFGGITFTALDIYNDSGAGLYIRDGGGKGGSFSFSNTGGTIDTTNGTAIDIDPVTLNSTFATVNSTNATTSGILLDTCTGTLAMTGGSITGSTGSAFKVHAGNATISYGGSITNTAGIAVEISEVTGGSVALSGNLSHNAGANGIDIQDCTGGTFTFSGATKTLNCSGIFYGINLDTNTNATFNFTGGGLDIDTVTGRGVNINGANTLNITGTGNTITTTTGTPFILGTAAIGAGGVTLDSVVCDGAAYGILVGGGGSGDMTVGDGNLQNITGVGVDLTNTGGTMRFNLPISTTTAGRSVQLTSVTNGSVIFGNETSDLIDDNGTGIYITTTTAPVTFNGNIDVDADPPQSAFVAYDSPATITLNGTSNTFNAGDYGKGLWLKDTTIALPNGATATATFGASLQIDGGTVNITGGGLSLNNTAGPGLLATSGGTITVQGAGNTVTTTTGTAVNIVNTTIGAAGMTFQSISSSVATNGIVLNNTGSTGAFTVTGDGAMSDGVLARNGSGGTLTTSNESVSLSSARNVTLRQMNLESGGHAIRSFSAGDLTFSAILFDGPAFDGWNANQLTGTNRVDNNSRFTGMSGGSGIFLPLTNTNLGSLTIDQCTFDASNASLGIWVRANGTSNFTLNITDSDPGNAVPMLFDSFASNAVQADAGLTAGSTASGSVTISDSVFRNATGSRRNNLRLYSIENSQLSFLVEGNTFEDQAPADNAEGNVHLRALNNGILGPTSGTNGRVRNNTFTACDVAPAIRLVTANTASNHNLIIEGNEVTGGSGIGLRLEPGGSTTDCDVRVTGNTFGTAASPLGSQAVLIQGLNTSQLNLEYTNNSAVNSHATAYTLYAPVLPTLNATISGNTFRNLLSDTRTFGVFSFALSATVCLDMNGNDAVGDDGTSGDGTFTLNQDEGTFNVEQADQAALEAANTGNFSYSGTINYNVPCPTPTLLAALRQGPGAAALDRRALPIHLAAAASRLPGRPAPEVSLHSLSRHELAAEFVGEVRLDPTAAGWGWFVDPTPDRDEEFQPRGPAILPLGTDRGWATRELFAFQHGPAAGKMDLLTVLLHELGHVDGLGHDAATGDLMSPTLDVGVRRIPQALPPAKRGLRGVWASTLSNESRFGTDREDEHLSQANPPFNSPLGRGEGLPSWQSVKGLFDRVTTPLANLKQRGVRRVAKLLNTIAPQSGTGPGQPGNPITYSIGRLPAGDTVTIQYSVTIDADIDIAQLSNQATVTADGLAELDSDDPDTIPVGDETLTPVELAASADFSLATVPNGAVGSPTDITVTLHDLADAPKTIGGDTVVIGVTGANTASPTVVDNGDGTYSASYTPATGGTDGVAITVNGEELLGSPFDSIVMTGSSNAGQSTATVPNGVVGQVTTVVVQARDELGALWPVGGDTVVVGVTGANTATPTVTDNGDGTYTATYTPTVAGSDTVAITLDGTAISGSPFSSTVVAGSSNAAQSTANVPNGVVGQVTTVVVQARDELGALWPVGGDTVAVNVTGTNIATPTVTDNGNGTYTATYTPTVAGTDTVAITLDGTAIAGSPFSSVVSASGSNAGQSTATVPNGTVGLVTSIAIQAKDELGVNRITGGDTVVVSITGANTATATVTDHADGTYAATYTPTVAGTDTVAITLNGTAIAGSPFSSTVAPGSSNAGQSTATVPNGTAGHVTTILVQAKDELGNAWPQGGDTVAVSVTGANTATAAVTDNADGTYTATYTPTVAGTDNVVITLDATAISGSPFASTVAPGAANYAHTLVSVPATVPAGTPVAIELTARDAFDNPIGSGGHAFQVQVTGANTATATVTDRGDGTYQAVYTPTAVGTDSLAITLAGTAINGSPFSLIVTPGLIDPDRSTLTLDKDRAAADGVATITATVTLLDAFDNPIPSIAADQFTITGDPAGLTVDGPSTATDANGRTTFGLSTVKPGSYALTVQIFGDVVLAAHPSAVFRSFFRATLPAGFGFVGLPFVPDDPRPEALVGDPLPGQLAAWQSPPGNFVRYHAGETNPLFDITAGKGFWFQLDSPVAIDALGEPTPAGPFTFDLHQGWNSLGNPFTEPIRWDPLQIEVFQNGAKLGMLSQTELWTKVRPYVWFWDPAAEGYWLVLLDFGRPTVPQFAGFWIEALEPGISLVVPPSPGGRSRARQVNAQRWMVTVLAQAGGEQTSALTVGVDPSLTTAMRLAAPPNPKGEPAVKLEIAEPDRRLAGEVRTAGRQQSWELLLSSTVDGEATLSWPSLLRDLPRGLLVELQDLGSEQRWLLNTSSSLSLPVTRGSQRRLRLTTRFGNLVRTSITGLQLRGNRGAGQTVELNLTGPAKVTLMVKGLAGRLVRTVTAEATAAGPLQLAWDGLDQHGRPVPRGNYLLEAVAESDNGATMRVTRTVTVQ